MSVDVKLYLLLSKTKSTLACLELKENEIMRKYKEENLSVEETFPDSAQVSASLSLRDRVRQFILDEYGVKPEHLWKSYPTYEVFRHEENEKWFAIIMEVSREKLGLSGDGYVDIMDIKLDPVVVSMMCSQKGYLPGYHMNKKYWLTILLDGSVPEENVLNLLDQSYVNTAGKGNKKAAVRVGPKDWLVPSNPKYYDVVSAFLREEVIEWKQNGGRSGVPRESRPKRSVESCPQRW